MLFFNVRFTVIMIFYIVGCFGFNKIKNVTLNKLDTNRTASGSGVRVDVLLNKEYLQNQRSDYADNQTDNQRLQQITQNKFQLNTSRKSLEANNKTQIHKNNENPSPAPKFGLDLQSFGSNSEKGRKRKKDQKTFIQRILPMMVVPFLISSSLVPMMLISLIHLMAKSAIIGKIGLILMLVNMFSNRRNPGGVSHHDFNGNDSGNQVAMEHYGWHGDEEYGAYVNRKRRRR